MNDRRLTLTQWGAYRIETRAGRVVGVHPFEDDPAPSPIGDSLVDNDRCRVLRPAVRRSWLESGAGSQTHRRGTEPFVEVGWDTALELVATELERIRSTYGNRAIFGGSYGWSSAGRFHHAQSQIHRFLTSIGGYVRSVNTYSLAAAEVIIPHVLGCSFDDVQAAHTSLDVIADHTDLFVGFGGVPAKNSQVQYGGQGRHVTPGLLRDAAGRGTRFVNISPLADDTSAELAAEWIPIRPNTDTALMLAMMWELEATGAADRAFLDRYCVGWDRLRAYLAGESDGVVRDAAWAASITGIPANRIRGLVEEMAGQVTMINAAWALQRAHHGEMAFWSVVALAAVLGQIGSPGGGFGLGYGAVGTVGSGAVRRRLPSLPRGDNPIAEFIPVARIADMLLRPGASFTYDGETFTFPDIRLVYWSGGNPFHHHQQLNRLVRAWERPDTVIVHEPYWTATARRADIVLPVTTSLERIDVGGASSDDHVFVMEPVAEPPGEARDDYDVFSDLAGRLGAGDGFTEGRKAEDWVRKLWEDYRRTDPDAPDFDTLRIDGFHRRPDGIGRQVLLSAFRADPDASPLDTPSGRIELWSETIAGYGLADCPPHPAWMEPYEWLGAAETGRLHLVSHQPSTRLHSQLDFGAASRAAKVAGREPARLAPADAAARGITDGDVIRIFNDRGACMAGAVVDESVMDGVVVLATGAWFDPDPEGVCRHGNPNVLTADRPTSGLSQGSTAHTCLVRVELVAEPPDPPTPHVEPELMDAP